MKTKEFIRRVEELGYECTRRDDIDAILVERDHIAYVATKTNKVNCLNCNLGVDIPTHLFNLAMEYTRTPIAEREEEKQYYLKSIAPYTRRSGKGYLNHITFTDEFRWSSKLHTEFVKTRYTTKEWENVTGYSWDEIKTWATPIEYEEE